MIPTTRNLPSPSYGSNYASGNSVPFRPVHPSNGSLGYGVRQDGLISHNKTPSGYSAQQHNVLNSYRDVRQMDQFSKPGGMHEVLYSSFEHQNRQSSPGSNVTTDSAVSHLFDRVFQSGSSSCESNGMSQKTSFVSDYESEGRSSPAVAGGRGVTQVQPMRSCSSAASFLGKDGSKKTADTVMSQYSDYDNISLPPCGFSMHERKTSERDLRLNESGSKPPTMTFQRCPLPTNDVRKHPKDFYGDTHSLRSFPQKLEVRGKDDFVESEEPLPCDSRIKKVHQTRDLNRSDVTGSPIPNLQELKDLQLTVFMRDVPTNKSFDIGAARYVNKTFQSPTFEGRMGSMSIRNKKPPLELYQPASPYPTVGPQSRSEISPVSLFEQPRTPSSGKTPALPSDACRVTSPSVSSSEGQSLTPTYTGPRLIPGDKIRENVDDQGLSSPISDEKDKASAVRLAKRLFDLDGFRKSDVAKHLGKRSDFAQMAREAYFQQFDFTSMPIDVALRHFLQRLVLSGETQERERILSQFSHRFVECNPNSFESQDSSHVLVCSIMLLNTDLHGENGRKKMTISEFIENLSGLNGGANFPRDVLKNIYQSIKNEPIEFQKDEPEENPDSAKDEQSVQSQGNPFLDVPDPSKSHEFKAGYLMRKCCLEADGRRTPVGKRGWRMFHASLRDLILYLHKDEHGFSCGTTFDDTSNAVRLHHALAMEASDYTKKQNVFRLRTADWAEYLFQVSDCQDWIDMINQVAAALSAPPLPGAVGSQIKFQRPLMPSSCTSLTLKDQLAQHEMMWEKIGKDLAEHRELCPEKGARQRVIEDYLEKETYLEFEQRRFQTYIGAVKKLILSNHDPHKVFASDGYFQKIQRSQGTGRSTKRAFSKEKNGSSGLEAENRNGQSGSAQSSGASHYRGGLHPAKSVPALLFESRV